MVGTHLHTYIILHILFSYIHQIVFGSRQKNQLVVIACLATLPVRALAHINTYIYTYLYGYKCIQRQKQQQEWSAQGNEKAAAAQICAQATMDIRTNLNTCNLMSLAKTYLAKEAHPLVGLASIGVKKAIRYIRALVLGFCGHFSRLQLSCGSCRTNLLQLIAFLFFFLLPCANKLLSAIRFLI